MSYRTFDVATMAAVSSPWVDPVQDRVMLEAIPLVAPLLPALDAVHQDIVAVGAARSLLETRLKKLADEAEALDTLRDQKLRGVYNALTVWAALLSDASVSASLLEVRDRIFRKGLAGTRRSYLAEAGNVDIVREDLTEDMRCLLATIGCGAVSLNDELDAWFDAGVRLGQIERERVRLTSGEEAGLTAASEISRVRRRWAQVTGTLLVNLALAGDSVDNETRIRILRPLQDAEENQGQARRRGSADDNPLVELDAPSETEMMFGLSSLVTGTDEQPSR